MFASSSYVSLFATKWKKVNTKSFQLYTILISTVLFFSSDLYPVWFFFPSVHSAVQQVESFALSLSTRSQEILLEAKDSNCLVLAAGQELQVCSLKGALLATFEDHALPISSICVVSFAQFHLWAKPCSVTRTDFSSSLLVQDSFRVVTASRDLSLRVLTWRNDREGGLTLESRYHLLGGSHTMSRSFKLFVSCRKE